MENTSCLFSEKVVTISLKSTVTVSVQRRNRSAAIRSYWSGLTCSRLVSNAPQKQGGLLVICHCVFNEQNQLHCRKATPGTVAGARGTEQVCPCPCWNPLRSQEWESPGTEDRSLIATTWISAWAGACVYANTRGDGESSIVTALAAGSTLADSTDAVKASSESQQSVNRHEANISCFLCLVKLLFSFRLRILGLFSNTIAWKITWASLRGWWLEKLQSVTWLSCNLCKRLVFCRRWPNATGTLQILVQRCFIRIHWRLFQHLWTQNITDSSTLAVS